MLGFIFSEKYRKEYFKLASARVVIGTLRVKEKKNIFIDWTYSSLWIEKKIICTDCG